MEIKKCGYIFEHFNRNYASKWSVYYLEKQKDLNSTGNLKVIKKSWKNQMK